ncbi:MAG: CGNR zinc finger domain-containing protein [Acidobacteriota bacterium]
MKNYKLANIVSEAREHHLIGNALCLDFANTLYGHSGTLLHEYLQDYRDLVIWSHRTGILAMSDAERLLRSAARHPEDALGVFHRAIALRENIYRIFAALAQQQNPISGDVASLDAARSEALTHSRLERTGKRFVVAWTDKSSLDRMLWPLAISASDLLTSMNSTRVRQCRGDSCDWLFLDTSRNHMRRWCSMSVCGNRSKVRRFFERKRHTTA